jgi:O-Antigen ligase
MEALAIRSVTRQSSPVRRLDGRAISVWALTSSIVLYLGIDGGGYDLVVRSNVAMVIWWIVLVGAAGGLLPAGRWTRTASGALVLFGGFAVWTGIAATWSLSSERTLQELSRVACYVGVLVLGIAIHRDREHAVRHTIQAIAGAIVAIACLALTSRLHPGLLPGAHQIASFLPGTQGRLGWPLNYWNALAALLALGLPLLLAIATSARTLWAQAAAAAAIPIVALCGYLTFSRGGAAAAGAGLVVFLALSPERVAKVASVLVATAGSAALILVAVHRSALEKGLTNAAARHQGSTLVISVVLVCAGVALGQTGVALAVRHGHPPRWLTFTPSRVRRLALGGVAACLAVALLAGAPARMSRAWQNFKHPRAAALHQDSIVRFGTTSGNGRYDYWKAALDATSGHLAGGSGPGTFQLLWAPRAPYFSYVQNAHSLYVETVAETGLVGLVLLGGFLLWVLGAAARLCVRSRYEARGRAAGLTGALIAFCISAASDWIWQVPALPAAFLLLAGAMLAPPSRSASGSRLVVPLSIRVGTVLVALASLLVTAVPLATVSRVRESQAEVLKGDSARALADARTAARLEPGAASPQIQVALVLELDGDVRGALAAARRAAGDEPTNWSGWLIVSRLEAEAGHPAASLAAYRRSRSLNPRSPLFKQ